MAGLSVDDIVNVSVVISPKAAQLRNFGALLIAGPSAVIDTSERMRLYTNIAGVVADFGTSAPEYLAAVAFFAQKPQPSVLYVGAWAKTATKASLKGGKLSAAEQAIASWNAITTGSMKITVDGVLKTLSALTFAASANLNAVAAVITTALAGAICTWNSAGGYFQITSSTTGVTSTLSYADVTGAGVDISAKLKLQTGLASAPVAGIAAETPLAAVTAFANNSAWYGLMFADTSISSTDNLAVAAYIEASQYSHIFGITTSDPNSVDPLSTTDIGYLLKTGNYTRSFAQYSSGSPYAVASMFGRAFTVDFTASNTTITLKFKGEPTVTAENLTETQAAALDAKYINYFVNYDNNTAIIQQGTMASGIWFDVIHGTDWLQNNAQNRVYNVLYQSTTKVPQTDAGINLLTTAIAAACQQARINGLVAPGQWNADGFGQLKTGQALPDGFYIYVPPISSQAQSDREARIAPTHQVAIKLGGAVHKANVIINVNQ